MLIKSIDIMGFKSFADKTTLKFGKGLTAVVGPNGSGKSNVSDAVRWVLGEQSTKSLRGTSMEDVIFSGTSTRKPHGYCEVTIHFDNSDRSLRFNDDNVSVTRRFYRSHEGEYMINGAAVRLKDVHELFMDTGLGRDGYSMIGQGKVDAIVNSKSNERRDIFEEASGISRYRYRKIEAQRRLDAAEENLLRLRDILEELKNRVGPLKEQSEKAEKFLVLAETKKELEIGLWTNMLNESKEAFRNQESKILIATEQYKRVENELLDFDATVEKNNSDFAAATVKIDELKNEIASAEESIARIEGEINVIRLSIDHNNENIGRLKGELEQLSASGENATIQIEAKRGLIAELESKKAELGVEANGISEKLSTLIGESESLSRQLEEKAMELNSISLLISENRVNLVTAESSCGEILSREGAVDTALAEKSMEVAALEKEEKELLKDLERCNEAITSAENSIKGYELRFESRKKKVDELKAEIDKISLDISEAERRAKILEDLQNSMEGYQHSVKACIEEAEKGFLRGVHGPVSRLIDLPKEYAVAIEIALGAAAQNIVVETDADAKRAINFLKTNNKGRATFLPISAIKGKSFTESGIEEQYGFVGIASELVNFDKKYKDIIDYLLGRTVVAEDLDSATNIAKKYGYRFKVVSLDGQVVNQGGSLTGGSLSKNAGLLSRSGDIADLKDKAKKLKGKLDEKQALYENALSALSSVEADILAVKSEATTANEDKIRVEGEIRRVSQIEAAAKIALAQLSLEKENGKSRYAELQKTIKTAEAEIEKLTLSEQEIKAEMERVSGGRDSTADQRESLTNRLTELKLSISAVERDILNENNNISALQMSIGGSNERFGAINLEIEGILSSNKVFEENILSLTAKIEDTKNAILDKKSEVENQIGIRNSVESSSADIRQKEKEKTSERERINGELERLRAKKESMEQELDDIIRRLYDEYQLTRTEAEDMDVRLENPAEAKRLLAETKNKIRALGNVNVAAIEEYKEVGERYEFMSAQIEDVEKTKAELGLLINDLTEQMQKMFMEGFERIGENFSKIFVDMFGGGHAELKLSDPSDVLQSGIEIVAKLPGKNVPSLEGLSGGEKALIAISIYFAIMQVNAPPFCFLDEVETALDDINVERFANYMKQSKLDTQFICITHRRGTMEAADMLYGVTMQEKGVTKLIELNVTQLEMDLKALEK